MNKNEAIITIIEAFDEITRLKAENEGLLRRLSYQVHAKQDEDGERVAKWAGAIYDSGRRAVFKKYGEGSYDRMNVSVTENDDGTLSAETFEHWYKDNYSDFPDFMSREDFLQEYEQEIRARYEEEKAKAIKEHE